MTNSTRGFNFLINSIFAEYVEMIIQNINKIFSPAFPAVFHKNYNLALKWIEEIEDYCSDLEQVKLLRSHPKYHDFFKSWNLRIYFQLRLFLKNAKKTQHLILVFFFLTGFRILQLN